MEGQHQGMDRPVDVSLLRIADDRDRWAVIATDASVGVPLQRLSVTGNKRTSGLKSPAPALNSVV